ncbi:MAG: asparagine synthase (glutamine-hydrolyzing) [Candidatus Tectimicrobiota bacterium]
MCGIVGLASQYSTICPDMLLKMRDTMRHRGPDDAGLWLSDDRRVGLAQRRLAIIDLSPAGHQPMSDMTGQLYITFNGEIYNYQALRRELESCGHHFRTASDTEVILEAYRAWGTQCLQRFNGMFAFALYDSVTHRLFCARDRAGEKPLFYRHAAGVLAFASELKALMADPACPRQVDADALNAYLTYGYVPGKQCILNGVAKLLPGQAMSYELDTNTLRTWTYWELPTPAVHKAQTAAELQEELAALLLDSVRLRLHADVPVGILLSGGIDSSLVTAMAARVASQPVKTFTIAFPGHQAYDEGPYARLVAQHFGTEHTELVAEPAAVELLPDLARQYDEPLADHAIVPTYLVSRLIRQYATVALGGDGGDELFGGYPHYSFLQQQQRFRRLIPPVARAWAGLAAARLLPMGFRGRNHLIGFAADVPHSIAHINMYFDAQARRRLLAPFWQQGGQTGAEPEKTRRQLCMPGHSPLQQATAVDFQSLMVDDYLVKVDRASMLASLEIRVPFLDHRIVEFAFSRVPDVLRATTTARKILLRHLAQSLLPSTLDLTRKQGFTMPLSAWFQGSWGEYMSTVLREACPQVFDQRMIQSLITGQRRGYANIQRLFALTMFELWRREYHVTFA